MIKAAEQHLAFAKKCEQTARTQLEAARKQLEVAKEKATAATAFLDETRDRLEVIDVDDDDRADCHGGRRKRKRRKKRRRKSVPAARSRPPRGIDACHA